MVSPLGKRQGQIEMCFDIVALQTDRLTQGDNGFVKSFKRSQQITKIVLDVGLIGVDGKGAAKKRLGVGRVALHPPGATQKLQCLSMIRLNAENARKCLLRSAGIVAVEMGKRFVDKALQGAVLRFHCVFSCHLADTRSARPMARGPAEWH